MESLILSPPLFGRFKKNKRLTVRGSRKNETVKVGGDFQHPVQPLTSSLVCVCVRVFRAKRKEKEEEERENCI